MCNTCLYISELLCTHCTICTSMQLGIIHVYLYKMEIKYTTHWSHTTSWQPTRSHGNPHVVIICFNDSTDKLVMTSELFANLMANTTAEYTQTVGIVKVVLIKAVLPVCLLACLPALVCSLQRLLRTDYI